MFLRVALAAAVLSVLVPSLAVAQEPLDSPGRVDRIEYVESTTTEDGYTWELYRNLAYPCSVAGYQTFAVGTPPGSTPEEPRPLWVRMRGGGVGFFDAAGNPQPSNGNKTEMDMDTLVRFSENNALNQRVNTRAGFRNVSVSMCSHDIYAGGDQLDPNNPNLTADGQPRRTNGLFATKAAIRWVHDRYPTTRTFLHGTSAGSFGTWSVAWSLQLEDRPVAGFVADSGVANQQYEADVNAQGGTCARGFDVVAAIGARLHPVLADPANQPHLLISRGELLAPAFNVWSRDDRNSCGEEQIACTMPDGSIQVMGNMECKLDRVSDAIAALPDERNSETMRVCVQATGDPAGTCAKHVVTQQDRFPNTDPAFPADYNAVISDWAVARLGDTPPELEVELRSRDRVKVRKRRARVRCVAGGYEARECKVKMRARVKGPDPVVARGSRKIGFERGDTVIAAKLTRRGRRLLGDAPRSGLRIRAELKVSELHTGRRGVAKGRFRVRN